MRRPAWTASARLTRADLRYGPGATGPNSNIHAAARAAYDSRAPGLPLFVRPPLDIARYMNALRTEPCPTPLSIARMNPQRLLLNFTPAGWQYILRQLTRLLPSHNARMLDALLIVAALRARATLPAPFAASLDRF